jgi:hypothetical protein
VRWNLPDESRRGHMFAWLEQAELRVWEVEVRGRVLYPA